MGESKAYDSFLTGFLSLLVYSMHTLCYCCCWFERLICTPHCHEQCFELCFTNSIFKLSSTCLSSSYVYLCPGVLHHSKTIRLFMMSQTTHVQLNQQTIKRCIQMHYCSTHEFFFMSNDNHYNCPISVICAMSVLKYITQAKPCFYKLVLKQQSFLSKE